MQRGRVEGWKYQSDYAVLFARSLVSVARESYLNVNTRRYIMKDALHQSPCRAIRRNAAKPSLLKVESCLSNSLELQITWTTVPSRSRSTNTSFEPDDRTLRTRPGRTINGELHADVGRSRTRYSDYFVSVCLGRGKLVADFADHFHVACWSAMTYSGITVLE
jgi:hypothetical protein